MCTLSTLFFFALHAKSSTWRVAVRSTRGVGPVAVGAVARGGPPARNGQCTMLVRSMARSAARSAAFREPTLHP